MDGTTIMCTDESMGRCQGVGSPAGTSGDGRLVQRIFRKPRLCRQFRDQATGLSGSATLVADVNAGRISGAFESDTDAEPGVSASFNNLTIDAANERVTPTDDTLIPFCVTGRAERRHPRP
jgi:hypothetical protein